MLGGWKLSSKLLCPLAFQTAEKRNSKIFLNQLLPNIKTVADPFDFSPAVSVRSAPPKFARRVRMGEEKTIMNIQIADSTVERIVSRLEAAGINGDRRAEVIARVLEIISQSPTGCTLEEIMHQMKIQTALPEPENALQVAVRLGLVGAFDGPTDLSTNVEHMNGFGL